MIIEHHPSIESELKDIINFDNKWSQGLGDEFIEEFNRQISLIALSPQQWVIIEDNIRRSMMRRFPFVIYFREIGGNTLRVTVVKHQRRQPNHGKDRK